METLFPAVFLGKLQVSQLLNGGGKEIVKGINRSAEITAQIAQLSDEQAAAIAQINTGINQLAQYVIYWQLYPRGK